MSVEAVPRQEQRIIHSESNYVIQCGKRKCNCATQGRKGGYAELTPATQNVTLCCANALRLDFFLRVCRVGFYTRIFLVNAFPLCFPFLYLIHVEHLSIKAPPYLPDFIGNASCKSTTTFPSLIPSEF